MKNLINSLKGKISVLVLVVAALMLFCALSTVFNFDNYLSQNIKAAGSGWHLFGLVAAAWTIRWAHGLAEDKNYITKDEILNVLILGISAVLSIMIFAGFVFNIA
jgi:hypothetical protein